MSTPRFDEEELESMEPVPLVPVDQCSLAELQAAMRNGICPLCKQTIRLVYMNFHEKFLMCLNIICEFPFGYEDMLFIPVTDGRLADLEAACSNSISKDSKIEEKAQKPIKIKELTEEEKELEHVKDIKNMTEELNNLDEEADVKPVIEDVKITNKKWIQTLHHLQKTSGGPLLKPEEDIDLNDMQGSGQLKINISPISDDGSPIKIEILNADSV